MIGLWWLGCTMAVVDDPADSAAMEVPGPSAPDPCLVPAVDVGTGDAEYRPLVDGDEVTVVYGPQGGWHVDVAGYVVGTEQIVTVQPRLVVGETVLTGEQPASTLALATAEPCGFTFFGVRAFLDEAVLPDDPVAFVCDLDGQTAELSIRVADETQELVDAVSLVLRRDAAPTCD